MIAIRLPAASLVLPYDGKAVVAVINESMFLACSLHNLIFRLVDEHQVEYGEPMLQADGLVLLEPPTASKLYLRTGVRIMTSALWMI